MRPPRPVFVVDVASADEDTGMRALDGITCVIASFGVGEENGDRCFVRVDSGWTEIIDQREKKIRIQAVYVERRIFPAFARR